MLPDLSLVVSFVTLGYCLLLFDGVTQLFRDADSGWHIRNGEAILAAAALPTTDPYSFTRQAQPWFAWEWGSDVLMAAAHQAGGLGGVALLYALAIAAAAWLWVRLHWRVGGNFWIAAAMAAPMLSTTSLHWHARPHVFSWVLILLALHCAEAAGPRFRPADAAKVFLGSAIWANLHASFFLAPSIAAIYAVAHLARPLIWELDRAEEWGRARWFGVAAVVSAAGTLVNPYGWRLHEHVVRYLADSELLARIGEFQSFNFHVEGAFQILLCVGLAAFGGAVAWRERRLAHFLLAAALVAMALRSARALPLVALAVLPLANGAIAPALRNASGLRASLRRRLDAFLAYSDRLRAIDAKLNGAALAAVTAALAALWVATPGVAARAGFPLDQFPVAAVREVEKLPPEARLLSPDKYGGYLIYRFAGRRKVFFDGRSDFYGAAFMRAYVRLVQVKPGWRDRLDEFHFTHALLPSDYSLVDALGRLGWKTLYRDQVAVLLERPGGAGTR